MSPGAGRARPRGRSPMAQPFTGAGLQSQARAEAPQAPGVRLEFNGIRRLTAERMALSARTVAPVTLTTEADATTLVRLREQALAERRDSGADVPAYTDFMVKLVAAALGEHPTLNGELTDEGIVHHARANI